MPTHVPFADMLRTGSPGRVVLALLASLWLAGCGEAISIDISPKQLAFEATAGGSAPPAQTVKATFTGYAVIVGIPPGEPEPAWLDVAHASSDEKGAFFRISIKTVSLNPATYKATLRFVTGKEDGTDLEYVDLPVTYTVRPAPKPLAVSPGYLSFSAASGQTSLPTPSRVTVTGDDAQPVRYTVTANYYSSTTGWLTVPSSGTTPQSFDVGPNTTALPAGEYSALLTFTPDNGRPPVQVSVSYSVSAPTFSVTPARLEFTALSGQALPAAQTVNVSASSTQAPVSYSVTVSYSGTQQGWLTPPSSGATPQTLSVGPNTTALPNGQHDAVVTFTPSNDLPPVQVAVVYTVSSPSLSVSSTQVGFTAFTSQSALPAAQSVTVSGQSGHAVNYAVSISYSAGARDWLTLPASGTTPQTLSVRPNTTALPAGQHTATVSFTPDNGQPTVQLSVSYTLTAPTLSVSPTQLSFTASSGQSALPTAQTVTVSGQSGQAVNYAVTATYGGGGPTNWLTLPSSGATPQTLELRPNTTALPPGQYSVVLSFTPDNGQPAARLTLTYSLSAAELRVSPSAPVLRVDGGTLESGLTSLVALTSTGAPLDWRVVSNNVSWLDFTSATGNTQSHAGLNLVLQKSALAGMDNGTYSGLITLAYGNASTPESQLDIPVKLTLAVPQVRGVTPYWIEAGRSLSHILRGEGFSTLQSGQALRFGTTTTSTYQVVSDTEIRLTVPALPVGAHPVSLDNALGLSRPSATLHAVQTPAMPGASLARTRYTERAIYDPLRKAVYTLDYADGVMYGLSRYRYVDGTWTQGPYITLPNMYDMLMDADGQSLTLFIGTGVYKLELDDPTATPQYLRENRSSYNNVERLNDGYLLDMGSCYNAKASLDGRRAIIMDSGCYSPSSPVRTLDAGSTQIQYTPVRDVYGPQSWMSVDRTARYVVIADTIYNAQWTIAGSATNLRGTFFSQDARRLFGLYADYDRSRQLMRVLDVSKPPVGGLFTQLAEVQVPGAQAGDGMYGGGTVLITPDDRTLIFVNQRQFLVMSVPVSAQ